MNRNTSSHFAVPSPIYLCLIVVLCFGFQYSLFLSIAFLFEVASAANSIDVSWRAIAETIEGASSRTWFLVILQQLVMQLIGCALLTPLYLSLPRSPKEVAGILPRHVIYSIAIGVVAGLVGRMLVYLIGNIGEKGPLMLGKLMFPMIGDFPSGLSIPYIAFFIFVSIGAPCFEELLHRGLAYQLMQNARFPEWVCFLVCVLPWAIGHVFFGGAFRVIYVFGIGIAAYLTRKYTNSLRCAVCTHSAANLTAFALT